VQYLYLSNTSLGTVKYNNNNIGKRGLFDCNSAQNENGLHELFSDFLVYPCHLTSMLSIKPDIGSGVKLQLMTELVVDRLNLKCIMLSVHLKSRTFLVRRWSLTPDLLIT